MPLLSVGHFVLVITELTFIEHFTVEVILRCTALWTSNLDALPQNHKNAKQKMNIFLVDIVPVYELGI